MQGGVQGSGPSGLPMSLEYAPSVPKVLLRAFVALVATFVGAMILFVLLFHASPREAFGVLLIALLYGAVS